LGLYSKKEKEGIMEFFESMESNERARAALLETVDNQLKKNDPPETRFAYNRLISMGDDNENARLRIAQCVAIEIFEIMKYKKKFDLERYITHLNNLPESPLEG
jgi:hypothetical protein